MYKYIWPIYSVVCWGRCQCQPIGPLLLAPTDSIIAKSYDFRTPEGKGLYGCSYNNNYKMFAYEEKDKLLAYEVRVQLLNWL